MTLITIQTFSLYGPRGGPRIMRSLLEDAPTQVVSMTSAAIGDSGSITELQLGSRRTFGRLEATRLWPLLETFALARIGQMRDEVEQAIARCGATAVHAVAHGYDFLAAHLAARAKGLPFFLTIHDHPAYTFGPGIVHGPALRLLAGPWREATHRFVISEALGEDLARRYGRRPYSVVTDGVTEIRPPRAVGVGVGALNVYFMGALHHSYHTNFEVLVRALGTYGEATGASVTLTVRGGGMLVPATGDGRVHVNVLPWGSQRDVEVDLERSHLLYLPLPLGRRHRHFVRYSLSTKLVTYIASGLPILFHGPRESAAAKLLAEAGAAEIVGSLEPPDIAAAVEHAVANARGLAAASGSLAEQCFRLERQRDGFWQPIVRALGATGARCA